MNVRCGFHPRPSVDCAALMVVAALVVATGTVSPAARGSVRAAVPRRHGGRMHLPAAPAIREWWEPRARTRPYGWPLVPFGRQHAIRGGFGDPRFGRHQRNFHFGIDIPAAGWTPVYAVAAGTTYLAPDRVAVLRNRRRSGFAYWHVIPAVGEHRTIVRGDLIGWVNPAWGHLHFAEMEDGRWMNPLRPGALEPYRSAARARIVAVAASPVQGRPGSRFDVTVSVYVPSPLPLAGPWRDARLAPTFVRWRLLDGAHAVTVWRTALDFRWSIPPNGVFGDVYAPTTVPNAAGRPGRYVVYLARDWDVGAFGRAHYRIEVQAEGARSTVGASTRIVDLRSLLQTPSIEPALRGGG